MGRRRNLDVGRNHNIHCACLLAAFRGTRTVCDQIRNRLKGFYTKSLFFFSVIFLLLTIIDISTTTYALDNQLGYEGNGFMSGIVSNIYLFTIIKLFCVGVIIFMMSNAIKQSKKITYMGMRIIVSLMLLVVANNILVITGSATTFWGVYTPNTFEYPGRVETTQTVSYMSILANGTNIKEWGTSLSGDFGSDFTSAINTRMTTGTGTFVLAVIDWAHPYRIFGVHSNKDVFYTDTISSINWSGGYYDPGFLGCAVDGNCNDIHKIGVLTTLNSKMSGFVDSNGNLLVAEGLNVIKFVRDADFAKTTCISANTDYNAGSMGGENCGGSILGYQITSMTTDSSSNIHILVGEYSQWSCSVGHSSAANMPISHIVYTGATKIYMDIPAWYNVSGQLCNTCTYYSMAVLPAVLSTGNTSTNIVIGQAKSTTVYLQSKNVSGLLNNDICPTSCGTISGFNGLVVQGGYAYIASSSENKIYRFPTTISTSSGTGFTPGTGGGMSTANINYITSTISSKYNNYYNFSKFDISAKVDMDSGFMLLGTNYGTNLQNYRWEINLIDPLGVVVNTKSTPACVDAWSPFNPFGTCKIEVSYLYDAPQGGWKDGNWQAKLYEADIDNYTHRALIATSATWNVYNATISANASSPVPPVESPTSGTGQIALTTIDGWTGLLGLGINAISKFMFAVIIIAFFMMVGALVLFKQGALAGAVIFASVPYCFFLFIEYIPSWSMVVLGIVVAIKIGFFK